MAGGAVIIEGDFSEESGRAAVQKLFIDGTDFDGIGCAPADLNSYDKFPALTRALLEKGYSASDIKKIYGGNLLRVMRAVEQRARELKSTPAIETKIGK